MRPFRLHPAPAGSGGHDRTVPDPLTPPRREGQPGNPSPGLQPSSRVSAPHRGTAQRDRTSGPQSTCGRTEPAPAGRRGWTPPRGPGRSGCEDQITQTLPQRPQCWWLRNPRGTATCSGRLSHPRPAGGPLPAPSWGVTSVRDRSPHTSEPRGLEMPVSCHCGQAAPHPTAVCGKIHVSVF